MSTYTDQWAALFFLTHNSLIICEKWLLAYVFGLACSQCLCNPVTDRMSLIAFPVHVTAGKQTVASINFTMIDTHRYRYMKLYESGALTCFMFALQQGYIYISKRVQKTSWQSLGKTATCKVKTRMSTTIKCLLVLANIDSQSKVSNCKDDACPGGNPWHACW